jgi:hypothetical protein
VQPEEHRQLGVDLHYKTWTLMRKDRRTPEEALAQIEGAEDRAQLEADFATIPA